MNILKRRMKYAREELIVYVFNPEIVVNTTMI